MMSTTVTKTMNDEVDVADNEDDIDVDCDDNDGDVDDDGIEQ